MTRPQSSMDSLAMLLPVKFLEKCPGYKLLLWILFWHRSYPLYLLHKIYDE